MAWAMQCIRGPPGLTLSQQTSKPTNQTQENEQGERAFAAPLWPLSIPGHLSSVASARSAGSEITAVPVSRDSRGGEAHGGRGMSAKPVMVSAGVLQRGSCLRTFRRGPRDRPSRACAVVRSLRTGLEGGVCWSPQLAREDFEGDGFPSREEPGPWSLHSLTYM